MTRGVATWLECEVIADDGGNARLEIVDATRRTGHHGEVGEREEGLGQAPLPHLREGILADDEDRRRTLRAPLPDGRERVDEIGRTFAIELDAIDREGRMALDRALDPGESLCRRCDRIALFGPLVGRNVARDEGDAGEAERLPHLLGGAQVTQVDRIEGAPEEPDSRCALPRLIRAADRRP